MELKTIIKIDNNIKKNISKKLNTKEIGIIVSSKIEAIVQERFQNSVDPNGNKWKEPKSRKGKPLLDTGALRKSIHKINKNNVAGVGTNIDYARIHNYGGVIKYKNGKKEIVMPKRQYMGFSDENISELKRDIIRHINKLFKE